MRGGAGIFARGQPRHVLGSRSSSFSNSLSNLYAPTM